MVNLEFFDNSKAQNKVILERDDYVDDLTEWLDEDDDYITVTEEDGDALWTMNK